MSEENNTDSVVEEKQGKKSSKTKKIILVLVVMFLLAFAVLASPSLLLKPAIYLYPEKPTIVEVELDRMIVPQDVIPKYFFKWKVLAHKDGHLIDLKPKMTDCEKLPNGFGFEYAQNACKANNYPYIYWDGYSLKKVPEKLIGWSVKRANAEGFLRTKADEMGMNASEKSEFVRYWTKKISEYPASDFRIYFLQNEEVDNWIKLKVSPKPDSWNRIQIIITPTRPNTVSSPYPLKKIERKGFTLVEWGGMIKDNF